MPTDFFLMSLASFLVLVGNYFAPMLIAKGMELLTFLPDWAKTLISTAVGAGFLALVTAISQLPQLQGWLDKSMLTVILAAVSALIAWAGSLVGKAQGQVLMVDKQNAINSVTMKALKSGKTVRL